MAITNNVTLDVKDANLKNENIKGRILFYILDYIIHILCGAVTMSAMFYGFRNWPDITPRDIHVILCVFGYHLLMVEAALVKSERNEWSALLHNKYRTRIHWILQIIGSLLAFFGSLYQMVSISDNLNRIHGILGFIAMLCNFVCLMNGLTSLYAYELRTIINGRFNKLSHIIFGTAVYIFASSSLCYGYNYNSFKNMTNESIAYAMIGITIVLTILVIIRPVILVFNKLRLTN